jgi:mRNA interferase MazF
VIRRGEIYWVALDPVIGSEADKTRPALVVSNNENNQYANTITVLAISSQTRRVYPFEVLLHTGQGGLPEDSKILAHQIRTIDKRRLQGLPLGPALEEDAMDRVAEALKLHLEIA